MRLNSRSAESQRIRGHLLLLGLSRQQVDNILVTIRTWEQNNGNEWTVGRLKSLKTWFIQHLGGNTDYYSPWFSKKRSSNGSIVPVGPFGAFFHDDVFTSHRKVIKALSALMVYTAYRLDSVSKQQVLKSLGSIQGPPLDDRRVNQLSKDGLALAKKFSDLLKPYVRRFESKKERGFKFTPVSLNTGKPFTTTGDKYLMSFLSGLRMSSVRSYLEDNYKLPKEDFSIDIESYASEEDYEYMPLSGKIVVLQERGAKARVIAMASASAQVAMYPLHKMLDSILRDLPTDCTHNQESGALWARDQLAMKKTVYSVDLSGATDNFPISLQLGLLRGLGLKDEAHVLESLSKGQWMLDDKLRPIANSLGFLDAVSYTKGQPQGLYSSFPLFALTHNLLVGSFCSKLGIKPEESFRILGDDIVISDGRLHEMYRDYLGRSGVPISEDKSISSDKLAEFAGFIITPEVALKPAKVPNSSNRREIDLNFISYLKVVGHEGLKYLPSRVRPVARRVAELPQEFGGLGLNPHGKSYDERVQNLLVNSAETKIPRYFSMESSFQKMKYAMRTLSSSEEVVLDWLYDQYNLFNMHVLDAVSSSPVLTRLVKAGIVEPHSLAYQFSAYLSVADVPDGKLMIGNKSPDSVLSSPFSSEFTIWRAKFDDLNESSYNDLDPSGSKSLKSHRASNQR